MTLSPAQVGERRAAFAARSRSRLDVVGLVGFFGLSLVSFVIMWLTRHSRAMGPVFASMAVFALGLACFLTCLPLATRLGRKREAALIQELGLACWTCGAAMVDSRGQLELVRGKCKCGEQIITPMDAARRETLPTIAHVTMRASFYNIGLIGLFLILGAAVVGALLLLDSGRVYVIGGRLPLAASFAVLCAGLYWSWTRLHGWVGAACPACGEALVGGKSEPTAGRAEETKSCPYCGATVAR